METGKDGNDNLPNMDGTLHSSILDHLELSHYFLLLKVLMPHSQMVNLMFSFLLIEALMCWDYTFS